MFGLGGFFVEVMCDVILVPGCSRRAELCPSLRSGWEPASLPRRAADLRAKIRSSRPTKVTRSMRSPLTRLALGERFPAANLDAMMKQRKELQEMRSFPPCC
jgi:hypothetical protein